MDTNSGNTPVVNHPVGESLETATLSTYRALLELSEKPGYDIAKGMLFFKNNDYGLDEQALYTLASKVDRAQYASFLGILTDERLDGIRYLIDFGTTQDRFPDLPEMDTATTLEFLLTCSDEVFSKVSDYAGLFTQEYYTEDFELQMSPDEKAAVFEAAEAAKASVKLQPLSDRIAEAEGRAKCEAVQSVPKAQSHEI